MDRTQTPKPTTTDAALAELHSTAGQYGVILTPGAAAVIGGWTAGEALRAAADWADAYPYVVIHSAAWDVKDEGGRARHTLTLGIDL
ncbi:hypothetical protein ACWDRR_42630 [Kitasatospora sp. NPDC003701]